MLAESSAELLLALATAIADHNEASDQDHRQAALLAAITAIYDLGTQAEEAGHTGLWSYCSLLGEQLARQAEIADWNPPAEMAMILADYLALPAAEQRAALLELLSDPAWPEPMASDDIAIYAELLQQDIEQSFEQEPIQDSAEVLPESVTAELADALAQADAAVLTQLGTVDEGDDAALLAQLAELDAQAANFELESVDLLGQLDEVNALLQQDWRIEPLVDALQVLSLSAQMQNNAALEAVCQAFIKTLPSRPQFNQAHIAEQLPLLLLDAAMSDAQQVAELQDRAKELLNVEVGPDVAAPQDEAVPVLMVDNDALAFGLDDDVPVVGQDMLLIFTEELDNIAQQLAEALMPAGDDAAPVVDEACELIERLSLACFGIGMPPLGDYLLTLQQAVHNGAQAGWNETFAIALLDLTPRLNQYCLAPQDDGGITALLDLLRVFGEVDDALLVQLHDALRSQQVCASTQAQLPERQKIATPADVSLAVPDDINAELMEGLLQELPVQAGAFAQAMQKVVSGEGSLADLEVAKRAAHTLKGAANTVGVVGLANLTHHLEDILIALSDSGSLPGADMANLLTEAGDCLEGMAEALMGVGPVPADSLPVFQRVLDLANLIDSEGIASLQSMPLPTASMAPVAMHSAEPQAEQIEAMVRIPARLVDEMLNLLGESIVSVAQMRELLAQASDVSSRMRAQNQNVQQLVGELEHRIEVRSMGVATPAANQDFDALEFESYNELHSISRRLTEATTDSRELGLQTEGLYQRLGEAIEAQHRLQVNNQEVVMRTRMVPVGTIAARLQRAVRQTARLLDKDVALNLLGEHTLVDSHLLNTMVDPLMHVLRNAIDHGIEAPAQRLAAGKSEQGQIQLSVSREGNSIVVRCKDDGAGLNLAAIRAKAERLKLIASDTVLTPNETARLILRHGFSIRDEASQVSGRGIGMDVVLSTVNALKGNLVLHTAQDVGLQIEMRFPVSLVASHALLVESQQQKMAISTSGILDLAYFDLSDVLEENGQRFIVQDDRKIPLLALETLFGLPEPELSQQKSGLPAILLQLDSGALKAIQVQRVIDSRDIVVKDFGPFVPRIPGMLGATVLGDGSVASVIDLRELLDSELIALNAHHAAVQQEQSASLPRALVVDDSISARRATTQFMRDSGFEVRPALDGLDAIAQLDRWVPDIVLVDMEMPRMNGLELASYFRAQAHLQHIPIIMITSRSTEKHRRQAELSGVSRYLVKPFNDEALIQAVMDLMQED